MIEILNSHTLLLASKSPRRRHLLKEAGIPFELIESDWPEVYDPKMDLQQVPQFLAYHKALNVKNLLKEKDILLTADTVVIHNNRILGKPKDRQNAINMLSELSDDVHTVVTGITLMSTTKTINAKSVSKVHFDKLSRNEVLNYVDTQDVMDKAGAYAIQGWMGHCKVKHLEGTHPNVMGLPVHLVYSILNSW